MDDPERDRHHLRVAIPVLILVAAFLAYAGWWTYDRTHTELTTAVEPWTCQAWVFDAEAAATGITARHP